jgi:lipoate-protein ligase B
MLEVIDWGVREYADALDAMRRRVRERIEGSVPDALILVEHPPVVTVGVQGDDGGAAESGLPVVKVERGGHATYHGPGQLVGYPVVDLSPRGRDVRRFVHDVEEIVIRALEKFDLDGAHVAGRRGVWIDGSRKIASIGIAVERWVTFHGFALNVDTDLAAFERFRPCGFEGSVMTSMRRELGRPVALAEVRPAVVSAWQEVFGMRSPPFAPTRSLPAPT